MNDFEHNEGCRKAELRLEQRRVTLDDNQYRARCVGCGATILLTPEQANEWYQQKKVVQFDLSTYTS